MLCDEAEEKGPFCVLVFRHQLPNAAQHNALKLDNGNAGTYTSDCIALSGVPAVLGMTLTATAPSTEITMYADGRCLAITGTTRGGINNCLATASNALSASVTLAHDGVNTPGGGDVLNTVTSTNQAVFSVYQNTDCSDQFTPVILTSYHVSLSEDVYYAACQPVTGVPGVGSIRATQDPNILTVVAFTDAACSVWADAASVTTGSTPCLALPVVTASVSVAFAGDLYTPFVAPVRLDLTLWWTRCSPTTRRGPHPSTGVLAPRRHKNAHRVAKPPRRCSILVWQQLPPVSQRPRRRRSCPRRPSARGSTRDLRWSGAAPHAAGRRAGLRGPVRIAQSVRPRLQQLVEFTHRYMARAAALPPGLERSKLQFLVGVLFFSEFLLIHPFADGNGRTARLLTNFILGGTRSSRSPCTTRTESCTSQC